MRTKICPNGRLIERRRVHGVAGALPLVAIDEPVGAMLGHEGVLDDDVLAPCSLEPRDVPGVVDAVVAPRQEERPHLGGLALDSSGGTKPPRNTQLQWSHPDENDHRPLTR